MKPYSIIAAIVASALLAAGCTGIGQSISLDSEPGILPATGGTTDFTFTPPYAWSADIRTDDGVDSWISISPTSGDASRHTVTVSAGPNERADSRIAFIDISSGGQLLTVQITQLGTDDETPGGDIDDTPVQIPSTYIRHITILDPSEGNEDNFTFEYDDEGRVTTMRGDSRLDDEYSMYYYTISYGERSVSITGDDGISIEATLDRKLTTGENTLRISRSLMTAKDSSSKKPALTDIPNPSRTIYGRTGTSPACITTTMIRTSSTPPIPTPEIST